MRSAGEAAGMTEPALVAAFEVATGGLVALDASGVIARINGEAARLVGRAMDACGGVAFDEIFAADAPFARARGERGTTRVTVTNPSSLALALTPVVDAGAVVGWLASVAPAQSAVDRAEANLRAIMERSPDPMVVHRLGLVVYANPAAALLLGYGDPARLLGTSIIELTHPDDRATVRARVERMLTRHEPVPLNEERFLKLGGGVLHAEVVALPIVFAGELSVLVFGHDLTERNRLQAEERRLHEEAQARATELDTILAQLPSGLAVVGRDGRIRMHNDALVRLLGRPSLGVGPPLAELFDDIRPRRPDGRPVRYDELPAVRALRGEEVEFEDLTIRHASGADRYLRTSASPIRDAQGEVTSAVVVLRDVTEMVEFDRLKDQFLRVVAHELKTPVAIMKGYAQLLLRSGEGERTGSRATLEKIDRGADRIDRIVRDMLYLSQLHLGNVSLEKQPLALDLLVAQAASELAPKLERHRLDVHLVPARVDGDLMRLGEVVRRLLDNAVRYSPEGGRVGLELAVEGTRALVSVEDEGVGIPADKQAQLFQRFFRAHAGTAHDYGGMGVGLYIAREIVRRHGGELSFASVEGKGSRFTVALPLGGAR